jgi:ABC-type multidrug transport system, permease component
MRSGELALAIEIPPGFARDLQHGRSVQVAAWVDGAMPMRAETVRGYVGAMHQMWLADLAQQRLGVRLAAASSVETRFRYNPDVRSLPAMVPAVIPLLLMLIPAMLTALSVVREKELGSIINLYVTPVTRTEFLLGKQLPYIALAMFNFLLMTALAVTVFDVPAQGQLCHAGAGRAGVRCVVHGHWPAGLHLLPKPDFGDVRHHDRHPDPSIQYAGLINPVSSLEGVGAFVGAFFRPRISSPSAGAFSARRWTWAACCLRSGPC